jgi:hypothetical protein
MQYLKLLTIICLTPWTLAANEDELKNVGPFTHEESCDPFDLDFGGRTTGNRQRSEVKCGEGDDSGLGLFDDLDSPPAVEPLCGFFNDEEDPGLEDAILWEDDDCRLTSPFLGGDDPHWVSL